VPFPPSSLTPVAAATAAGKPVRSSRRAHRGGRSFEGKTQGMPARRQLAQGFSLLQRTLRVLQMTQLRGMSGAEAEPGPRSAVEGVEAAWVSGVGPAAMSADGVMGGCAGEVAAGTCCCGTWGDWAPVTVIVGGDEDMMSGCWLSPRMSDSVGLRASYQLPTQGISGQLNGDRLDGAVDY
jgi:hypothetical protein